MADLYAAPPYHVTQEARRIAVHATAEGREQTLAVGWATPFKEDEIAATFRLFAKSPDVIAAGRHLLDYLTDRGMGGIAPVLAFRKALEDATRTPEEAKP